MNSQRNRLLATCVALLVAQPLVLQAQTPKAGQAGMAWLNMPIGSRAAGMGYAHVAVADDASSFFWNPGASAFSNKLEFMAHRTNWIADINVNAAAVSYNLGRYGIYGLNVTAVDWGTFKGTRRTDNSAGYEETGNFSPISSAIGMTYAYRISREFGVGVNFKYMYERLGTTMVGSMDEPESVTAKMNLFAIDLGTLYYIGYHDLRIGMSLRNFSNEEAYRVETFPLPMTFRVGAAMDVFKPFSVPDMHRLTLAADFIHSRDYSERVNLGAEYGFNNQFFLRGGYKINYDLESVAFGAGVNVKAAGMSAKVDYSYVHMDLFSNVNMLSLRFGL